MQNFYIKLFIFFNFSKLFLKISTFVCFLLLFCGVGGGVLCALMVLCCVL